MLRSLRISLPVFKRLFHSVFTKLLVIILVAGLAITVTLVAGFAFIRFHSLGHLDRNLIMYGDYLKQDLGDPPDLTRAEQIAQCTGMAIAFDHPENGWKTAGFPAGLPLERAHVRWGDGSIRAGHLRAHTFIRIQHAGGNLIFISPHWSKDNENFAWQAFVAMAAALLVILAAAYFFIRRMVRPLHDLRTGVEHLGAGRLEYRVPQSGHDEFAGLSEAFNTMAGRLNALMNNKEQLLLDVSHELRSPLTRLKIQVEMLRDDEIRESLKADLNEMEAMVTTILEQARLRNTAGALATESTDMAGLIKAVAGEFGHRRPGVIIGPVESVRTQVDPDKMRGVLRNLIDNALKNTPEDGEPVAVSLARDEHDNSLTIIVADKGAGICESALPHLFEPFYRTDASRSRKTGGFGLGLHLCKAVIDAHDGEIDVSSTPGKGTRVKVSIPVNPELQYSI